MLLKVATMLALTVFLAACHQTDIGRSVGFPSPQERSGQP